MATDKKKAIIAAALELFAQKGYSDTSTSAIAKAAGVAEGTIFHHFHSKNGILLKILHDVSGHFFKEVEECIDTSGTGYENLLSLVRCHFDFADRRESELFLILRDLPAVIAQSPGVIPGSSNEAILKIRELYLNATLRGVEDGSIATPDAPSSSGVVLGMVIGVLRQQLFGGSDRARVLALRREVFRFCQCALKSCASKEP